MDPNETLVQIRRIVGHWREDTPHDEGDPIDAFDALAGYVESLDEWLSRGGFPPEVWREGPPHFGDDPDPRDEHRYTRAEIVNGTGFAPEQTFTADPLGPPDPAGAVLPEDLVHDPHAMESMYPRDTEDGEGIHLPSYGA